MNGDCGWSCWQEAGFDVTLARRRRGQRHAHFDRVEAWTGGHIPGEGVAGDRGADFHRVREGLAGAFADCLRKLVLRGAVAA